MYVMKQDLELWGPGTAFINFFRRIEVCDYVHCPCIMCSSRLGIGEFVYVYGYMYIYNTAYVLYLQPTALPTNP